MSSKNLNRWLNRLRSPLEKTYKPWATNAAKRLSQLSRWPTQIDGVSIDTLSLSSESRQEDLSKQPSMIDCAILPPESQDPWILRLQSDWIHLMIDRLLGGNPSELAADSQDRLGKPLSSIDWRVASYCIEELAYPCLDLWQPNAPIVSPRADLRPIDSIPRVNYVRVHFRINLDPFQDTIPTNTSWIGQWLIPESFIISQFGRLLFGDKDPAKLTVVLARSTISRADLEQLEVGDIVSTEQLANEPAEVVCQEEVLFRGVPGVFRGSKALRLIGSQAFVDRA